MRSTWQLQEAKNRLSEVVEDAMKNGPQIITRRGVETAVILSFADYRKMLAGRKTLSQFFRESPLADVDLDLSRDAGPWREESVL